MGVRGRAAVVQIDFEAASGIQIAKHGIHFIDKDHAQTRLKTLSEIQEWESPELARAMSELMGGYTEARPQVTGNEVQPCLVIAAPEVWSEEHGRHVKDPRCPDFGVGDIVLCPITGVDEWRGLSKLVSGNGGYAKVGNDEVVVTIPVTKTVFIVPAESIECVITLPGADSNDASRESRERAGVAC